ncbi:MAG TPA: glycoside hydrolase family 76 protein [Solirubrobacteraceae bacterium]|nr:glycoside hydrolase family 76 protein [Solirubrobacteraceae bacterium]
MSLRRRLALAALAALALLLAPAPAASSAAGGSSPARTAAKRPAAKKPARKKAPVLNLYAKRALTAYEAMQQSFYVPGTGLYRGAPEYSYLWPFSQALAATVSLSHVTGERPKLASSLHALTFGLQQYLGPLSAPGEAGSPATGPAQPGEAVGESSTEPGTAAASPSDTAAASPSDAAAASAPDTAGASAPGAGASTASAGVRSYDGNVAPPVGPGGASYYDDNEWVGIELARLYELDHEPVALQQAQQIMEFVMAGWQTTGPSGQSLPCPGGVPFSNAANNTTRNTVTDGPGAELAVQLYKITREARYLQFAEMAYGWVRQCLLEPNDLYADHINDNGTVQRTLWSYNQGSMMGAGVLLYQATHEGAYLYQARQTAKAALAYYPYTRLSNENPFFVAVYFRNLMYLDSVTHDPPGNLPAREYVYYAWLRHRLSDNLFAYGNPPTAELLWQAAIVQVYALLAIPPSTYF